MVWAILVASLSGTDNPVSYPHYGAWFIALLAEASLLALGVGQGYYSNGFTYARMTVQAFRLLILIALPILLLTKSTNDTPASDEESAALLGQVKTSINNVDSSNGVSRYGSIAASPTEADTDDEEAKDRKKEEERQRKLDKRLQDSGSWLGYDPHLKPDPPMIMHFCGFQLPQETD